MDFLQKVLITIFVDEILVFIPLLFIFFYSVYNLLEKKFSLSTFFILLLPFFFIFYQYSYLPNFFASIGQDSIIELNADFGEAFFYIKTFFSFLFDTEIFRRNRFWLLLVSSFCTGVLIYLLIKFYCKVKKKNILNLNKYLTSAFTLVLILGVYKIISLTFISFEAGKKLKVFEIEFRKNIDNYKIEKKTVTPLKTLIYIGESTSALNMSLYGYPFKTTPWLNSISDDDKFIKFNSVYATHTHTTPSLLGAFSLCIKQNRENCSINTEDKKDNLSIIDALNKTEIDTYLFSTQGSLGGLNLANKIVFNTKKKYFSDEDEGRSKNDALKLLGDRYKPKLDDLRFFKRNFCNNKEIFKNKSSSLTLFHSYAGHGHFNGYLGYVPPQKLFVYPEYINKENFLGKDFKNFRLINEYDTALKYTDSAINTVFNCGKNKFDNLSQPMVFIYFSDHGESPATARGHDSSRLTYEMLHVPLVVYFNDAAYNLYEEKFKRLKKLENKNLTLKFISDLIVYLYDVDILNNKKSIVYKSDEFKSLNSQFILGRKKLDGSTSKLQTFWNYEKKIIEDENFIKTFARQDTSINLWQMNNFLESKKLSDKKEIKNLICKHRANSFIEQYKASLSNGCFETDILFLKNKTISAHEIESSKNLIFDNFLYTNYKRNTVWLDSKNINVLKNCNYALKWLTKNANKFVSILVEVPTKSINNLNDNEWKNCINNINNIDNINVGFYMPTNDLNSCSSNNLTISRKKKCEKNFTKIIQFLKETNIRNITFDFVGYEAINNFAGFKNFKWHIWHVNDIQAFNKIIINKNIGIILLKNDKFSNNLN
jgi:glucan phosphoethanolaminetransferase (alkaline phosphatase superfamily)